MAFQEIGNVARMPTRPDCHKETCDAPVPEMPDCDDESTISTDASSLTSTTICSSVAYPMLPASISATGRGLFAPSRTGRPSSVPAGTDVPMLAKRDTMKAYVLGLITQCQPSPRLATSIHSTICVRSVAICAAELPVL